MTELKPGMRVRVTYETTVSQTPTLEDGVVNVKHPLGYGIEPTVPVESVEVLRDDPANAAVGDHWWIEEGSGYEYVKVATNLWVVLGEDELTGRFRDDEWLRDTVNAEPKDGKA